MTNNDLECLRMTYNDLQWHLGRSCALKKLENAEKVKRGPTDQPTDQPSDQPTDRLTNQPTKRPTDDQPIDRQTDKAGCRVA